jgi:ribosomal protein S18 acetylase RimI-like enzyme
MSTDTAFRLVPAAQFTIAQLTAAYNQTRVDYVVPMPMNAARLAEYVAMYDVVLGRSVVAVASDTEEILGLGMLGLRPQRAWITRLGVVPTNRRHGAGRAIMRYLLAQAEQLPAPLIILEVIKNNAPAYHLFIHCGFAVQRELLILRRPPGLPKHPPQGEAAWLTAEQTLDLLAQRAGRASWLTETESYAHALNLGGVQVRLPDGATGWLVYQEQRPRVLPSFLSGVLAYTEAGEPATVARALFGHLYQRYPDWDTHTENLPAPDPHVPAFLEAGYVESFRRIEMHRPTPPSA